MMKKRVIKDYGNGISMVAYGEGDPVSNSLLRDVERALGISSGGSMKGKMKGNGKGKGKKC